jgi:hypothetical protein
MMLFVIANISKKICVSVRTGPLCRWLNSQKQVGCVSRVEMISRICIIDIGLGLLDVLPIGATAKQTITNQGTN